MQSKTAEAGVMQGTSRVLSHSDGLLNISVSQNIDRLPLKCYSSHVIIKVLEKVIYSRTTKEPFCFPVSLWSPQWTEIFHEIDPST